jgi:hypothetical protein
MLTDYMVSCPYPGCRWSGSLLPSRNRDAWLSATPTTREVVFQCPRCRREWYAALIGDDVRPLPLDELISPGA